MQAIRITAENVKGRSFKFDLHQGTFLVGDNFAGKTAIIEAIRLALMGYIPEIGKTAKATWELSSGPRMTARLDLGGPVNEISPWIYFETSLYFEGNSIKTDIAGAEKVDMPLLVAERYFGMTDAERADYVFRMIKIPDNYTASSILSEMEMALPEKSEASAELGKFVRDRFLPGVSIQDALKSAIADLRDEFAFWNKREKDTQGTARVLTELKLRQQHVTAAALGGEKAITETRLELDRLIQLKGKLEQREAQSHTAKQRAIVLRNKIAERPAGEETKLLSMH